MTGIKWRATPLYNYEDDNDPDGQSVPPWAETLSDRALEAFCRSDQTFHFRHTDEISCVGWIRVIGGEDGHPDANCETGVALLDSERCIELKEEWHVWQRDAKQWAEEMVQDMLRRLALREKARAKRAAKV